MKTLFAILAAFAIFPLNAEELERKSSCEFCLEKTEVVDTFAENEAEYVFEIQGIPAEDVPSTVYYSIDGETKSSTLNDFSNSKYLSEPSLESIVENGSFRIKTTPGKHVFQIWFNINYAELYSDSLKIGSQERATYSIHPTEVTMIKSVEKPVIYLYPEQQQEVSVKVQLNGGEFAFTYPPYNDGWKVTAHPNGQLELDSATYNYLFWEAELPRSTAPTYMYDVAGSRVTEELVHILQSIGMNGRETADFITYWAPRMQQHRYVRMGFLVNEECDELATLDITPTPDHVYRVYVFWYAVPEPAANNQYSPKLPAIDRDGFTVLEWGGMELRSPF